MRRKKLLEKIWQFLKLFDCFGRNLVFLSIFAIFSNFWLFTFRHFCCVWGGKNCQRRFGATLPQSWKWCQFLAIEIRTRWCGQNWRTGVYQTQTASQVCQKNIWILIDFPAKNDLVKLFSDWLNVKVLWAISVINWIVWKKAKSSYKQRLKVRIKFESY